LKAAKARNPQLRLGNPCGPPGGAQLRGKVKSIESRKQKASEHARRVYGIIKEYKFQGMSLRAITRRLTEERKLTPTGKGSWEATTVKRVIDRVGND
jgi:hypothetical protein